MAGLTTYYAGADGKWHHPTLPDWTGGDPPPPPPPPPDPDSLWFGTTLFGQSYARYKLHTIGTEQNRYKQGEYDCSYGGNHGSAVLRVYQNPGEPFTWANACPSYVRDGQCIMYSFLDYDTNESNFKQNVRDWFDDKDSNDPDRRVWLIFKHEWDNDTGMTNATPGVGSINDWYDRQLWVREVLEEGAYDQFSARNGGTIRFGFCSTGTPFQKSKKDTDVRSWRAYVDGMLSRTGATAASDIWDFCGADKYNPAWDGASRYMPWANWVFQFERCHQHTGLPIVIGEAGSARADSFTSGWTTAQRNQERSDWLATQYANIRATGYFDAVCYWRVPATSDIWNAWSTNMITPTGYNATLGGSYTGSGAQSNGGFDDQPTSDVQSEFAVSSITAANALGIGPALTYYTDGGGFG